MTRPSPVSPRKNRHVAPVDPGGSGPSQPANERPPNPRQNPKAQGQKGQSQGAKAASEVVPRWARTGAGASPSRHVSKDEHEETQIARGENDHLPARWRVR